MEHTKEHYRISVIRFERRENQLAAPRPILHFEVTKKTRDEAEQLAAELRTVYHCVNVHKVTTTTNQRQTAI